MEERYERLSQVPEDALKPISFGPLKGKSDINPQWRYEALTEVFGLCGVGWKYEVVGNTIVDVPTTGEKMIFVFVNLYVRDENNGHSWTEAIPGSGGDFLIKKDKNGLHGNDEGFKMAITDALGNAAKMVGVAADVYRGTYDTKYERQQPADPPVTTEQLAHLKALCTATECPYERLLQFYKVDERTMTNSAYNRILRAVEARRTKEKANESTQKHNDQRLG